MGSTLSVHYAKRLRLDRLNEVTGGIVLHVEHSEGTLELHLYDLPEDQVMHLCKVLSDGNSKVRREKEFVTMTEWLVLKEMGVLPDV